MNILSTLDLQEEEEEQRKNSVPETIVIYFEDQEFTLLYEHDNNTFYKSFISRR